MSSQNVLNVTEGVGALPPGDGDALWVLTQLITFKSRQRDYTVFEGRDLPHGMSAPPPHIHTTQDEAFYVLEGEYEFLTGEGTVRVGPGSFVHVPKGTLHTLRTVGEMPGRTLVIVAPPGPVERFFEDVGVPADDRSTPPDVMPDLEKLMESAARNDLEFVLPAGPDPAS
jgi:mannose-6-phosphate isomerase-like protein (cupin superfamily)